MWGDADSPFAMCENRNKINDIKDKEKGQSTQ